METLVDVVLGRNIPYISYAVPFFFLLIGVELLTGWWTGKTYYRFNDSVNDLSCGIMQQVTGIFLKTFLFAGYLGLYERYRWTEMTQWSAAGKWMAAIALFLGVDFCYYWFHRVSHQMNAPWAGHIAHHSSEEYNLAVALRQGSFQAGFSWVFYLPLAIVGFPPLWFIAMSSFNTLYQFWIHTRAIGKLGWLEWVINTPSHHRVHHGRNPKYLDRNHAGTLIIWDRMFGTFQEEEEEPVYGLVRPLSSWNPAWANVHEFVELWRDAVATPFWWDKIKIWFMPPGWRPRGLPERPDPPEVSPDTVVKYDARVSLGMSLYVLFHFTVTLLLATTVMAEGYSTREWGRLLALTLPVGIVLWGLTNFGAIFERRHWVVGSELSRLGALWCLFANSASRRPEAATLIALASVALALSALWFYARRGEILAEAESTEPEMSTVTSGAA